MDLKRLSEISGQYLKLAGILKVPDMLYKEISNWAISAFSYKLLVYSINKAIFLNKERNRIYDFIQNIKNSKEILALSEFISYDEKVLKHFPTKDFRFFDIKISYFNADEVDENIDLAGVYEWVNKPQAFSIFIVYIDEDKFNFSLNYNYEDRILKSELQKNVSKEFIYEILMKHKDDIGFILYNFFDFRFESIDNKWMNSIIYLKQFAIKHLEESPKYDKTFIFDNKYLPKEFHSTENAKVNVNLIFDEKIAKRVYEAENFSGLWSQSKNLLVVYKEIPTVANINNHSYNIKSYEKDINDIKQIVYHELQHFMQTLIKRVKNLNENGGLPSKSIRDKEYNELGYDDSNKDESRLPHALRDIEFYTDLNDVISNFKSIINKVPINKRKQLFKMAINNYNQETFVREIAEEIKKNIPKAFFIRDDDKSQRIYDAYMYDLNLKLNNIRYFFQQLKSQPLKYNKAVKEFYKEVKDIL